MRKIFILALALPLVWAQTGGVAWAADLDIYQFWGEGCPHCAKEAKLLDFLEGKYPDLKVHRYEVNRQEINARFLAEAAKRLGVTVGGVPFLVIGDKPFVGYSEAVSPAAIENRIQECLKGDCPDTLAPLLLKKPAQSSGDAAHASTSTGPGAVSSTAGATPGSSVSDRLVTVPVFGQVDARAISLPVLTVVMGLLDGFNPCAMWTLLFLISLLLGMGDRKRMWALGTAFILASGAVYFMFMAAWLNLVLFLGLVMWVRLAIGGVALVGGGYSLKEFFTNKEMTCKVGDTQQRQAIFKRIRGYVGQSSLWLALGGIILLAFMVNLIELVCSAGLPAVYTQVLALNGLPRWQYYLYILSYIVFFMLDDLLVFAIAMATLQMTALGTKYARISRLVGGLVMVAIGLLLIFKPEWLTFG